jgi:hypothetical protein
VGLQIIGKIKIITNRRKEERQKKSKPHLLNANEYDENHRIKSQRENNKKNLYKSGLQNNEGKKRESDHVTPRVQLESTRPAIVLSRRLRGDHVVGFRHTLVLASNTLKDLLPKHNLLGQNHSTPVLLPGPAAVILRHTLKCLTCLEKLNQLLVRKTRRRTSAMLLLLLLLLLVVLVLLLVARLFLIRRNLV